MAVVKNEMQQGDQGQAIDRIFNIAVPVHLWGMGHRVAEESGAAVQEIQETVMLIPFSDGCQGVEG